ncbi:MAG TPA: DUF4956 domain-containing protein [Planctomycetota bacterium]|nr:DUF4956 domain-containing protein [Planctomycetota bacterium]
MDFLHQALGEGTPVSMTLLATRLGAAFVLGLLAAGVYALACSRGRRKAEPTFLATLVLLSLLVALVTVVIGNNVARAFSLVGTLAIVRFRTVVEDTRDTAFVIYAVACGMCAGSGYLLGPVAAAPMVLVATWIFSGRKKKAEGGEAPPGRLVLRLSSAMSIKGAFQDAMEKHLPNHRLLGLATARGGSSLDATYAVELPEPEQMFVIVNALSSIEGVQEVEVKSD